MAWKRPRPSTEEPSICQVQQAIRNGKKSASGISGFQRLKLTYSTLKCRSTSFATGPEEEASDVSLCAACFSAAAARISSSLWARNHLCTCWTVDSRNVAPRRSLVTNAGSPAALPPHSAPGQTRPGSRNTVLNQLLENSSAWKRRLPGLPGPIRFPGKPVSA